MDDDFNTGGAIGELFEVVHALNRVANSPPGEADQRAKELWLKEYRAGMVVLKELVQILGLFKQTVTATETSEDALTTPLLGLLIDLRAKLRKEKNFGLADEIRKRLTELGVTLEDRADGTRWRIEQKR
jgi:cysteinyl-tRNA synthetase